MAGFRIGTPKRMVPPRALSRSVAIVAAASGANGVSKGVATQRCTPGRERVDSVGVSRSRSPAAFAPLGEATLNLEAPLGELRSVVAGTQYPSQAREHGGRVRFDGCRFVA